MSDLLVRSKTAAWLILWLGLCVYLLPNPALALLAAFVWAVCCLEFLKVFTLNKLQFVTIFCLNAWLFLGSPYLGLLVQVGVVITILALLLLLLYQIYGIKAQRHILLVLGLLLINSAFSACFLLAEQYGVTRVLTIWALVALVDAGGYGFGRAFGKAKLMPAVSPKKTWAGVLGALFLQLLVVVGLFHSEITRALIMSFAIVIGAIVGDLWFSYIKRLFGIKDYSKLLPGHGGILDRLDGVIMVLPLVLLCAKYLQIS